MRHSIRKRGERYEGERKREERVKEWEKRVERKDRVAEREKDRRRKYKRERYIYSLDFMIKRRRTKGNIVLVQKFEIDFLMKFVLVLIKLKKHEIKKIYLSDAGGKVQTITTIVIKFGGYSRSLFHDKFEYPFIV